MDMERFKVLDEHIQNYEEFIANHPRIPQIPQYDNFPLIFADVEENPLRQTPSFLKFQTEHPDLERRLTRELSIAHGKGLSRKHTKPFEKDMYEAYRIMRA